MSDQSATGSARSATYGYLSLMRCSMENPEWEMEEGEMALYPGKKPEVWMPRVFSEERDTVVGRRYEREALIELPERMKADDALDWAQEHQPEPLDEWFDDTPTEQDDVEVMTDGGTDSTAVEQLPEKWRKRAEKARKLGYTEKAIAVLDCADELEERIDADDDPGIRTDGGEPQETGTEQTRVGQVIGDVSDETLGDAATELQQCADHISCANERRGTEFQLIADHLRELQGETLLPSDEVEDRVDGALISGFLVGASASLGLVVLYLVALRAIEVML